MTDEELRHALNAAANLGWDPHEKAARMLAVAEKESVRARRVEQEQVERIRALDSALSLATEAGLKAEAKLATQAERIALLEGLAAQGLANFHGTSCSIAGGIRPSDPAECEDETCRTWAAALEVKP